MKIQKYFGWWFSFEINKEGFYLSVCRDADDGVEDDQLCDTAEEEDVSPEGLLMEAEKLRDQKPTQKQPSFAEIFEEELKKREK